MCARESVCVSARVCAVGVTFALRHVTERGVCERESVCVAARSLCGMSPCTADTVCARVCVENERE